MEVNIERFTDLGYYLVPNPYRDDNNYVFFNIKNQTFIDIYPTSVTKYEYEDDNLPISRAEILAIADFYKVNEL